MVTTDLSASPMCLGRSWKDMLMHNGRQGGGSRQPAQPHQGQILPQQPIL